jgi:hypothetical protein
MSFSSHSAPPELVKDLSGIGLLFLLFLVDAVLSPVFFNPPGGINEFLLAREKRMAVRTDVHVDFLDRGARFERIPARTDHLGQVVLRMYFFFQG